MFKVQKINTNSICAQIPVHITDHNTEGRSMNVLSGWGA